MREWIKKWMSLWGLGVLALMGCSTPSASDLEVQIQGTRNDDTGNYQYHGGLFKVWVTLDEGVSGEDNVRWKTGKADIAIRNNTTDANGLIASDTVYLHWESLPDSVLILDTTITATSDSTADTTVDTTYEYLDSIAVVIDGEESLVEAVEICNILPKIDSVWMGGIGQIGDSTITLAVHPGERMELAFRFTDAYNTAYPVQNIAWPDEIGSLAVTQQLDTMWTWTWDAPNSLMDTLLPLVLTDKGGYGTREYSLHLVVYNEAGAAWTVSGNELVKFSPGGSEVARVDGGFQEVSEIVVNSNSTVSNKVWVLDAGIGASAIYQFDTYGRLVWADSTTLNSPYSLAVDVESRLLWVSDLASVSGDTLYSSIHRFNLNGSDSVLQEVGTAFSVPGPVRGLSVDQYECTFVWFVSPEMDFVGYIRTGDSTTRIFADSVYAFNRPTAASYDATTGLVWIADSSRVLVMDSAGNVQATITGFTNANSLSAAGGVCWVADIVAGVVYRFAGTLTGSRSISDGLAVDGFIEPASVSTYAADQGVWVADKGAGEVVRLDVSGSRLSGGSGLTLPTLVRVNQVIE